MRRLGGGTLSAYLRCQRGSGVDPMIRLIRIVVLVLFAAALGASSASAQLPDPPGRLPGALPAAPPVPVLPPPVAPPPVPSAVRPIPSPSYGIPPGVTRPVTSSTSSIYRVPVDRPPKQRKHYKKRHPRVSEIVSVAMI
jgi:hypothetical protein